MSLWCRRRQKRLLAEMDTGRPPSEHDQRHLDRCDSCSNWYARQDQLHRLLAQVQVANPGPHLSDQVMAFIYRSEQARRVSARSRRPASASWVSVLRREAWPIAFAMLAVLWGAWISPAIERWEERSQVHLATLVQSIPSRLDQECAELQRQIAERLIDIVRPDAPSQEKQQDQSSLDPVSSLMTAWLPARNRARDDYALLLPS